MNRRVDPEELVQSEGGAVPDWLMVRPEVSPGAKICYGLLVAEAEAHDSPTIEMGVAALSERTGTSIREASRYLAELKALKLVTTGTGPNEYLFLAHPWVTDPVSPEEAARAGSRVVHICLHAEV
jgi:hypothetical protein